MGAKPHVIRSITTVNHGRVAATRQSEVKQLVKLIVCDLHYSRLAHAFHARQEGTTTTTVLSLTANKI